MIKKFLFHTVLFLTLLSSCSYFHRDSKIESNKCASIDLDSIRTRGKLIAVTDINSTNYFIYKGEPMGFNFELLKSFSDHIGIDLEIVTENNIEEAGVMLNTGRADLLAIGLPVSSGKSGDFLFTEPVEETGQVLVQRKPHNWSSLEDDAVNRLLIRNRRQLTGRTVYVQSGSTNVERLLTLAHGMDDSIRIVQVPFETEKLIKLVAEGEIDYTVCNENVGLVNSTYYPGIDVATQVSSPQEISWEVRKNNSDELLGELNRWIRVYKMSGSYDLLYAKYFKNSRASIIVNSDYYAARTGRVSQYDDVIRKLSGSINWDWRLLASLICQESHFNPNVRSAAGAYGLMQLMPSTGENYGVDSTASPENNMKAGIQYIKWLHSIFDPKISDENERISFILAAYNAGPGHVLDAMKLAGKNGMDPQKWDDNVAVWMLKKSQPVYYNDIVVKNGYFRGTESVAFVSEIINRYQQYKNLIPGDDLNN